jgi:thioredoxin reductase
LHLKQGKIKEIPNIEVILNTEVKEFRGDKFLQKLILYNNKLPQ